MMIKKPVFSFLTVGTVFVAVFAAVFWGFYYYAENLDNILPDNDSERIEIKPIQMYNTGVLKYLAGDANEAIKLWQERLAHAEADNAERFYLHSNLGISYLALSKSEKEGTRNQMDYAVKAVNSFKDAYSYLQTMSEYDALKENSIISLELAKKRYTQLVFQNKEAPLEDPLKIVQELLQSEKNIYDTLSQIGNASDQNERNTLDQILLKSEANQKLVQQLKPLIQEK